MAEEPVVVKIKAHLQNVEDLTLLVLKAHLLLEEQMIAALNRVMPNAQALDDVRLTFYQRVKILRALNRVEAMDAALGFAEKLNRIRNTLAHQLEPTGVEDAVTQFVTEVAGALPVEHFDVTGPPALHMAMSVGYICGLLNAFQRATRIVQATSEGII